MPSSYGDTEATSIKGFPLVAGNAQALTTSSDC